MRHGGGSLARYTTRNTIRLTPSNMTQELCQRGVCPASLISMNQRVHLTVSSPLRKRRDGGRSHWEGEFEAVPDFPVVDVVTPLASVEQLRASSLY